MGVCLHRWYWKFIVRNKGEGDIAGWSVSLVHRMEYWAESRMTYHCIVLSGSKWYGYDPS